MNVFDEMGNYWAEMADKNQTERQTQLMKNILKPEGLVLDLACGTGRHSIPLSKEGYNIVGFDVSLNLLRIAKKRWGKIQVVRGDMRFLPFKSGAFSAAVSMDTSFGYLPSENDDLQSLRELRQTLNTNGLFILDVYNREHLIRKYNRQISLEPEWTEYPSFWLLKKRTVTPDGERLEDLWEVHDKAQGQIRTFKHTARLYEFNQLKGLLEMAGFIISRFFGGYEYQPFSADSSKLIFVATAM